MIQRMCILFGIILLTCILYVASYERFMADIEKGVLKMIIDTPIHSIRLYNPYNIDIRDYIRGITTIDIVQSDRDNACELVVCDAFRVPNTSYAITSIPETYKYFAILKKRSADFSRIQDLYDIYTRKYDATIGVHAMSSADAIQANNIFDVLLNAHSGNGNSASTLTNRVQGSLTSDMMVIYGTLQFLKDTVQRIGNSYTFLNTEQVNIHMLKSVWEYARMTSLDTSLHFSQVTDRFPIRSFFTVDMFICQTQEFPKSYPLSNIVRILDNVGTGSLSVNNYYTMFFTFHPVTLSYNRLKNERIASQAPSLDSMLSPPKLQILEQYASSPKISTHVNGDYDRRKRILSIENLDGLNIVIQSGDIVRLTNQSREEENGVYKVISDPYTLPLILEKQEIGSESNTKEESTHSEPPRFDFVCYGDPYAINKGLCQSKLDETGNLKKAPTFWDKPCEKNDECPFFQKNDRYPNYRGGCNDGFCEFPLGVQRFSWRKYNPETLPICRGCPPDNLRCCGSKKPNGELNTDYVFELDFHERRNGIIDEKEE